MVVGMEAGAGSNLEFPVVTAGEWSPTSRASVRHEAEGLLESERIFAKGGVGQRAASEGDGDRSEVGDGLESAQHYCGFVLCAEGAKSVIASKPGEGKGSVWAAEDGGIEIAPVKPLSEGLGTGGEGEIGGGSLRAEDDLIGRLRPVVASKDFK